MKNLPHCAHNKLFKKCKSPIGLPHYKHFFFTWGTLALTFIMLLVCAMYHVT